MAISASTALPPRLEALEDRLLLSVLTGSSSYPPAATPTWQQPAAAVPLVSTGNPAALQGMASQSPGDAGQESDHEHYPPLPSPPSSSGNAGSVAPYGPGGLSVPTSQTGLALALIYASITSLQQSAGTGMISAGEPCYQADGITRIPCPVVTQAAEVPSSLESPSGTVALSAGHALISVSPANAAAATPTRTGASSPGHEEGSGFGDPVPLSGKQAAFAADAAPGALPSAGSETVTGPTDVSDRSTGLPTSSASASPEMVPAAATPDGLPVDWSALERDSDQFFSRLEHLGQGLSLSVWLPRLVPAVTLVALIPVTVEVLRLRLKKPRALLPE